MPLTDAPPTPVACSRHRVVGKACTVRPRLPARSAALAAPWVMHARVNIQVVVAKAPWTVVSPRAKAPVMKTRR